MFNVVGLNENNQVITEVVSARKSKDIWSNPEFYGFNKVFSVKPVNNRQSRNETRETKWNT